jgi:lysozyme
MRLAQLRSRLKRRKRNRDRQSKLWRRTGKAGHGKAAKRHAAAVRALRKHIFRITRVQWISRQGVEFIAEFEGLPNGGKPYNDPIGYATVGYGHLLGYRPVQASDFNGIWLAVQERPGRLSPEEARELLRLDLRKDYEPAVRKLFARGGPLDGKFTQGRYDALVSFAFNLGPASVQGVPGFETMGRAIAAGDLEVIADAFLLYDKAGGEALPGLTRRRQAEKRLFLTGHYS